MSVRIEITPVDLAKQKVTEVFEGYFEIYDDRLISRFHFYADQPIEWEDESMGWESIENNFYFFVPKKSISALELNYASISELWEMKIFAPGIEDQVKAQFKKESDAINLFIKLQEWLLK